MQFDGNFAEVCASIGKVCQNLRDLNIVQIALSIFQLPFGTLNSVFHFTTIINSSFGKSTIVNKMQLYPAPDIDLSFVLHS